MRSKIDFDAMKIENRRRVNELLDEKTYDPVTGKGSPIPRFPFRVDAITTIYLPEAMKEIPMIQEIMKFKTFREYSLKYHSEELKEDRERFNDIFTAEVCALMKVRINYDFEYWGVTTAKIKDKVSKKLIPFRMRKAQRIIFKILETERLARRGTIFAILVKARQFGGSTLIALWFEWIQTCVRENWHSSIVTEVEDQARRILDMYKTVSKNYPESVGSITLSSFEGSSKNRIIKERGSIISVGSMQKPDSLRSADNALVHCSEVGLWKKTEGKEPDDLVQTLLGSLSEDNDTAFIMESTAKGVGNFFHQTWEKNNSFIKIFIPWFMIDLYVKQIHFKKEFVESWSEYEWYLWDLGATIEGIYWYRGQLARFRGDRWRMQSEYPSTPEEAFSSTGSKFYPLDVISEQKKLVFDPVFIGDIYGDASTGKESLMNISLQADQMRKENALKIWIMPDGQHVKNRFVVSVDIGGVSDGSDFSTINVIDRIGLMYGGAIERAALWRGHIDQDLLAWKAAQIAKFYDNALLVVEVNSLEKEEVEDTEGVHYLTILDTIVNYYDNLYTRESPDRVRGTRPTFYGFHMNKSTKPMVMEKKKTYLRERLYFEYSQEAVHEMSIIEMNKGKIGNVEGKGNHDDIDVSTATAIYVSDKMDAPCMIKENKMNNTVYAGVAGI